MLLLNPLSLKRTLLMSPNPRRSRRRRLSRRSSRRLSRRRLRSLKRICWEDSVTLPLLLQNLLSLKRICWEDLEMLLLNPLSLKRMPLTSPNPRRSRRRRLLRRL